MSTRDLTRLALFAALNSVFEIAGGGILHILNVPVTGNIMVAINLLLYLAVRMLVPKMGSVALVGFVTALVRFMNTPGFAITPGLAIFMESMIVEIILSSAGVNRLSAIISGMALQLFVPLFRFGSTVLLYGWEMRHTAFEFVTRFLPSHLQEKILLVILLLLVIYAFTGIFTGWICYIIALRLKRVVESRGSGDPEKRAG